MIFQLKKYSSELSGHFTRDATQLRVHTSGMIGTGHAVVRRIRQLAKNGIATKESVL